MSYPTDSRCFTSPGGSMFGRGWCGVSVAANNMQDLTKLTAVELTDVIRSRRASATEVLEAHLARIREENPRLNAVITLDEEGARKQAREADDALARGELWGPLHGLPMTLKDGHSTKGMRTTSGYEPLANYVPAEDGTVAARLRAAGAIIMGKTNVSPLLGNIQSDNAIFGRTSNPWNVERTSGGSSGGAASALAVGMTPLEIGSDFAGSIRIPAHFCGVYGLKTTEHRVSMWGHIPDIPGSVRSHRIMWAIGPLARSVEDLALAYRIISGPDGYDVDVPPVPVQDAETVELKGLRVAWAPTFPGVPVAASIRTAIERLAVELESAGAVVEEALPAVDFGELAKARAALSRAVRVTLHPSDEQVATMVEYLTALDVRDKIVRVWDAFLEKWDLLLCPVTMTTAFPHCAMESSLQVDGEAVNYWRAVGHSAPFNFTGHPAAVVPVARDSDGLPIGVQLVGRRWGEAHLLGAAARVAEVAQYS
ncbi:MAG: amidase [Chloroflexota bacterium]